MYLHVIIFSSINSKYITKTETYLIGRYNYRSKGLYRYIMNRINIKYLYFYNKQFYGIPTYL